MGALLQVVEMTKLGFLRGRRVTNCGEKAMDELQAKPNGSPVRDPASLKSVIVWCLQSKIYGEDNEFG